eukprot:Skav213425  [mRNA]  locus=scaffold38:327338:328472:- [translate_table: standard]
MMSQELQLRNRIFQAREEVEGAGRELWGLGSTSTVRIARTPAVRNARRLFKEIDIDGSGFISPDEILGQTSTPAVRLGASTGGDGWHRIKGFPRGGWWLVIKGNQ